MIKAFEELKQQEADLLLSAPILVCILVAGADGTIDRKEVAGAIEMTKKEQKKSKGSLLEFYQFATEDFEDKLKIILQNYPSDVATRSKTIVDELSQLNLILPKLNSQFALELYTSFKAIAMQIAKSSGGLLGISSVGEEEIKYVNLPMIDNPGSKE